MLIVRSLQFLAVLGLITGFAQAVIDSVYGPHAVKTVVFSAQNVNATTGDRANALIDPVSRTVMRMLGPGMLLVLCEIAVILDRRLQTHPDAVP